MTLLRLLATTLVLLAAAPLCGGCRNERAAIEEASALVRAGRVADGRARFERLAGSRDQRTRVLASLGAARASFQLRDEPSWRRWLERAAADPEVPGASEEAYFELAEMLRRDGDRSRALNFYYRAAAGAERERRRFLYQRAIQAIAAMGMMP